MIDHDVMQVMVYDDDRSIRETLSCMLRKVYGFHRIETEDNIFGLRIDLAINRPRLLILDYMYEGGLNLNFVSEVLRNYKGCGIIYSSVDKEVIQKELGPLPENFRIVKKGNVHKLKSVITMFMTSEAYFRFSLLSN